MKYVHLITTLILLTSFSSCTKKETLQKPNVLLLYMDDLRPELATYGHKQILSPNIDRLADEGIQFNQAYCNVSVCGASRASMLTGMYPAKNYFINYATRVDKEKPNITTLPGIFKKNGYRTISNGKVFHHLDDKWNDWDKVWRPYAFEANDQGLSPIDYWQSLWRDYLLPENAKVYKETNKGPSHEAAPVEDNAYIDGIMTDKVISDIEKLSHTDEPFLLTAGFISNHLPFNAPKKYWDLYERDSLKQPYNNFLPKDAPKVSYSYWGEMRAYTDIPRKGQVSDSTAINLIHGYYATVSYVDALIGKILKKLESSNLKDNTIVILVSDHGYNLQEHTFWAKFNSYKITERVPFIISTPFGLRGKQTNALVELVDLYPTLIDLCHLTKPSHRLDGESLVTILDKPTLEGKDYIFMKNKNGFSIKTKKGCYTDFIDLDQQQPIASMYYDHIKDPDENSNVVSDPTYKEEISRLKTILYSNFKENMEGGR